MDRNGTLKLLLEQQFAPLWRYLFRISFNPNLASAALAKRAFVRKSKRDNEKNNTSFNQGSLFGGLV
jgi:hypothetical protein